MIDQHDRRANRTEDGTFLAGAGRLQAMATHPVALSVIAVVGAVAIFLMGVSIGETLYLAFEGEAMLAAAFGGTMIVALLTIIAIGVRLDRRHRRHRRE